MAIFRTYLLRAAWLCACAALAVLMVACGGPDVPLNGTIVDAYTGKPVIAARINIGGAEATTDAGGKYQLARWSSSGTLQIAAKITQQGLAAAAGHFTQGEHGV